MNSTELPDVNVLIALHVPGHVHHAVASDWLTQVDSFATCPMTEAGLVRLLLNPAIAGLAVAPDDALATLRDLRAHPKASFWPDGTSLATSPFAARVLKGRHQVTDLHLLGLATSRGGRLVTLDAKLAAALRTSERRSLRVLGS